MAGSPKQEFNTTKQKAGYDTTPRVDSVTVSGTAAQPAAPGAPAICNARQTAAAKEALKLPTYHKAALPKAQDVTDCIKWLNAKDLVKETYGYDDLVIKLLGE